MKWNEFMKFSSLKALFALCVILSGCGGVSDPAPFDKCRYQGNSLDERWCLISFGSILSSPAEFDGRRVRLRAWVKPANDVALLYPSQESMTAGEEVVSMVVYDKGAVDQLSSLARHGAVYAEVSGVFHLNRGASRNPEVAPYDVDRLGRMEVIEAGM